MDHHSSLFVYVSHVLKKLKQAQHTHTHIVWRKNSILIIIIRLRKNRRHFEPLLSICVWASKRLMLLVNEYAARLLSQRINYVKYNACTNRRCDRAVTGTTLKYLLTRTNHRNRSLFLSCQRPDMMYEPTSTAHTDTFSILSIHASCVSEISWAMYGNWEATASPASYIDIENQATRLIEWSLFPVSAVALAARTRWKSAAVWK